MTWCQSAVRLGQVGGLLEAKSRGSRPLKFAVCSSDVRACVQRKYVSRQLADWTHLHDGASFRKAAPTAQAPPTPELQPCS